jgi:hypothetical protein
MHLTDQDAVLSGPDLGDVDPMNATPPADKAAALVPGPGGRDGLRVLGIVVGERGPGGHNVSFSRAGP